MRSLALFSFLVAAWTGLAAQATPSRHIYISNDDHTDYMWTADAATYDRVFVEMLDFHLDLIDRTIGNPSPFQNRFNTDGSFWLWNYERSKGPAAFERLIDRIKSGHISSPYNALVSCYGGQPAEAVLRGMYYAGHLERRYDLRFSQAVAMENQTFPLGLVSLWAGAGAKYSWRGVCGCASRMPERPLRERAHEIYWSTGLDGQRVLMKWHSLHPSGNQQSGGYAEAFDPVAAVRFLDGDEAFLQRYRAPGADAPYSVRGAFGFGWDALDRKTGEPYPANPEQYPRTEHFHLVAQAESDAHRQVIVSNQEDFFQAFAARYGAALPSESLTTGNEWDLYSASLAETSARVRRAVEKLRAAEALATVASLHQPTLLEGRAAGRDQAFMSLGLYWEHDWTADGPVSRDARAGWQNQLADDIERYVDTLHADAAHTVSSLIPHAGDRLRVAAFNPLGWTRSDVTDVRYDGPDDIHVHDVATSNDVPHQFLTRDGARYLRFWGPDLPAVGYKVFEIRPGAGTAPREAAATLTERVFENTRVQLTLDRDGAIARFIDKRDPSVDLAATIDGLKLNDLAAGESGGSEFVVESSGPVSVTLRITSNAARRHVTRVTLYRDGDRVDLHNQITENFGDVRHWSFSFNLEAPDVRTEEVGAIIHVKKAADGGHYADRNARYDYATLNHFADISNGSNTRGVTLSNWDASFVKLGRSTPTTLDTATAQLHVLAGGQVDGDQLGIRNQNGATSFLQRFALRPHTGYDPVAAMTFALEHQNPVIALPLRAGTSGPLPAIRHSLITLSDPRVLLWALKPAEEGIADGVIARLWNISDASANATLTFAPGLAAARRVTHVETNLAAAPIAGDELKVELARQQLQTFRLIPARR
jgi:alpha-mannosidase